MSDRHTNGVGNAEPGKQLLHKPDTGGAGRDRHALGIEQRPLDRLDRTQVRFRRPCPHRDANPYRRKIDIRAGSLTQKLESYSASPMPAPSDLHFGLGKRTGPDAVRRL